MGLKKYEDCVESTFRDEITLRFVFEEWQNFLDCDK